MTYNYHIVDSMVALGGKLCKTHPDEALLQHRIAKGDKSFYNFRRHLFGKAPVSLKLRAWVARPLRDGFVSLPNYTLEPDAANGYGEVGAATPP